MGKLDTNFRWFIPFIYGYGSNTNGRTSVYEIRVTPFMILTWTIKNKKPKLPKVGKDEILEYKDGFGNWYHYDEHLVKNEYFKPFDIRVTKVQNKLSN